MNVLATLLMTQVIGLLATAGLLAVSVEVLPSTSALVWAGAAGLSGVAGLGCLYLALSRGTMGLVAPLAALVGAALPALVGIVNGEAASPLLLAGMVLALCAVVVISLPDSSSAAEAAQRGTSAHAELALIVLSGLGFAGFYLFIDQSRANGGETWWPILTVRMAGLSVVVLGLIALTIRAALTERGSRPSLRVPLRLMPLVVLSGLGDLGGNLFFLLANAAGSLAVAVVLSSLYPVVTAVLARIFLRERLSRSRLMGVAAAIGGVVLIAAGQT
ncbi:MAG: EamA family transporter [Chloroflexi bacterium]|nr:EamA family transporter [Chloroflexota bacterium]